MKANGSGRPSNGTWTTIPPPRSNHCAFRHIADKVSNKYSNPYEVLSDSSVHSLQKYRLPNGEVIYTSFKSIEDISTYFSNLSKYRRHPIKLNKQNSTRNIPPNSSHREIENGTHKKLMNNDDTHTKNQQKTFDTKNSNPQIPDRDKVNPAGPRNILSNMASKTIVQVIDDTFGEIDIDNVHIDTARSMCKKIASLLFLTMEEWIDILSMEHITLKTTLSTYKTKTNAIRKIIEKEGEDDPQDMSYTDAMILDDEFDIAYLYYASKETLIQMANQVVDYYSFAYDGKSFDTMTRPQLICQLYEFLYKVVEYQGLAKNGVVLCPEVGTIGKDPTSQPLSVQTYLPKMSSKKLRVHSPKSSSLEEARKDQIIQKMLSLTMEEISSLTVPQTEPFINAFHKYYGQPLPSDFFTNNTRALLCDHLLVNILELHSYYTAPVLNESFSELAIMELPSIQVYNEYYLAFNDDNLMLHDIILIKPDDIRSRIIKKIFHAQATEDVHMDDCSDLPIVTQTQTVANEITLFKHKANGHPINDTFFKVIEYNKENNPPSFEADENTLSVLGLLTEHDIKFLSRSAILIF